MNVHAVLKIALCLASAAPAIAIAGEADVIGVKLRADGTGDQISLDVTIRSRDAGWNCYAERFEVVGPGRHRAWHNNLHSRTRKLKEC